MNMNKKEKSNNTLTEYTNLLTKITTTLKQTKTDTFQDQINLYGTINYTRTQYLTQLSKTITENEEYKNIFFNYTSLESMILDLLMLIESDIIYIIENKKEDTTKTQEMIQYTTTLLEILKETLQSNQQDKITQKILKTQNQYYQLIYNEKIDYRIK